MDLQLSPAARIIPPSDVTGDHWLVEHVLRRRRYRASRTTAAALAAAARPQPASDLVRRLAGLDRRTAHRAGGTWSEREWQALVTELCRLDLIVDARSLVDDPELAWLVDVRKAWSRYGWHEAAEYHVLTFDYPCVDYSEAIAILTDRDRMRGYQSEEPDDDRYKLDYVRQPGPALPALRPDLIPTTAATVWTRQPPPAAADLDTVSKVLSAGFGITGYIVPKTNAAPLIRRSSPSGGARNPSEGYLVARDLPGLASGWYHVTMRPFSLRRIDGPPTDDTTLHRLFPNTLGRFPGDVGALVVLTSVFERNMYRYREPRTYRTVHMDAGHIAGTVRIAARALGLTAAVFYCDAATEIEHVLGLDGWHEGYLLTVAIAAGRTEPLRIPAATPTRK